MKRRLNRRQDPRGFHRNRRPNCRQCLPIASRPPGSSYSSLELRVFSRKKNYFQNFNKIQTDRAYSTTVEAQIIENWMNKKAIKWFTCSGSGRSITRQSWTIAHLHYFSSVCLRTNKQFHWINCHENRYAEHVIIKLQLTQVNCVFFLNKKKRNRWDRFVDRKLRSRKRYITQFTGKFLVLNSVNRNQIKLW